MNEYRIKVSIRNNLILKKIEEQGFKTVAEFERYAGVHHGKFNGLVAMRERPLGVEGEFSSSAKKLMECLGAAPCELWTDEQLYLKLDKNSGQKEVSRDDVHYFLEHQTNTLTLPSPEDAVAMTDTASVINEALKSLTSKEEKVLRLRFEHDLTLKEIGDQFGVQSERIRQIEQKALRKLRERKRKVELEKVYEA